MLPRTGFANCRRSPSKRGDRPRLAIESLEGRQLLAANPVISEFMAENKSTLLDGYGNSSDWIEIHNAGDAAIDLAGWHLTDNANLLTKWQFPDVAAAELDPGERIVVFASENQPGVVDPLGYLHAGFKLNKDGEYVALVMPDGATVASEFGPAGSNYPAQYEDISYGVGQAASTTTLVAAGAAANVLIPDAAAEALYGTSWRGGDEAAFAAAGGLAGWTSGSGTGVGYDTAPDYVARIGTDVEAMMLNVRTTAYVRIPFAVDDPAQIASLALRMDYDDGFVAYLNGAEVARQFFTGEPTWNSFADTPNHEAGGYEEFDISSHVGDLVAGTNILAIVGLNRTADSSDFLILPELVATVPTGVASLGYMAEPTPGAVNGPTVAGFVADTKFSVDRGFYDAPFDVTITSATPGATIVYTTNGSAPTLTNGTQAPAADATTPPVATVPIAGTTTLRAAAFKDGFEPANADAQTYLFTADILAQADMDPDIVNNPAYSGIIADTLKSIPTMSLVMDNADIFGASGIYTNPGGSGIAWERPVSVEFFDPNHVDDRFQINAGIRIHGADARNHQKKPLRIIFRESYGASKLDYPLYPDSPVTKIDKLVLRGGGHEGFTSPHSVQADSATFIRDTFMQQTQAAMGQLSPHSRYVHLYINGRYWGLYYAQERPDADFNSEYLGGAEEDWDVLNTGASVVDGNKAAWNSLMTLANAGVQNDAQYQAIQQFVDVDNLIDNMIARIWSGDVDWLRSQISLSHTGNRNKNWYAARDRNDGRFRFFVWDAELSIGKGHTSNRNLSINIADVDIADSPGRIYAALRQYAPFQLRFADRLQKHFFDGGALTAENNQDRWNALAAIVRDPVVAESARWGDAVRGVPLNRDGAWQSEVDWIANTFFAQRNAIVLDQFRAMGLYPSVAAPTFSQHGGVFSSPLDVTVTVAAGTIYYTTDGSDPRDPATGNPSPTALSLASGQSVSIASSTLLRTRARSGATWSALVEATFLSVTPPSLRITEIMYNPAAASGGETAADNDDYEFVEIKNVGSEAVSLSGVAFTGGVEFDFSSSAIASLGPGEFAVVARNAAALAERYGGGLPIAGEFASGTLDNAGETLRLEGALGEVIHEFAYRDGWHPLTDGQGFSLSIIEEGGNLADWGKAASWKPSSLVNGSPGADDPNLAPLSGAVAINEIAANSGDALGDRIELLNTTGQPIDVGQWYLSDDAAMPKKYSLDGGAVLAGGAFVVLSERDDFGGVLDIDPLGGELLLSAYDAGGQPLGYQYAVAYGASPQDVSQGRYVTSTGREDFVALASATFGAANAGPRVGDVIINEVMYHPDNPDEPEFIELRNTGGGDVLLGTNDSQANPWRLSGAIDFDFPSGATIPSGGMALVVQAADGADPVAAAAAFRAARGVPASVPIFIYTDAANGSLSNDGETLVLERPVGSLLAADFNADGIVSLEDLAILQKHLGTVGGAAQRTGDATGDGNVDRADVAAVAADFGRSVAPLIYVREDAVRYDDGDAEEGWPAVADGQGSSLSRIDATAYGNDVVNWTAGSIGGTPGAANTFLDVTPPTTPTNVTATVASPTQIDVAWSASTDAESGVLHYAVYRDGALLATTASTSYADTTVEAGSTYTYSIGAVNNDGFASGQSSPPADATIVGVELVSAADAQTVVIRFSHAVTAGSAEAVANYQLDGGATVSAAVLDADGRTVTLSTSTLAEDVVYTLSVSGVVATSGQAVAPGTTLAVVNASVPLARTWDFETQTLEGFVELTNPLVAGDGIAFSGNPVSAAQVTDESGVNGNWFVRSDWHTTNGKHGDGHTGILESDTFRLGRNATFDFLLAGGNHPLGFVDPDNLAALPAATAISLEVEVAPGDWEIARTATSMNTVVLAAVHWDAADLFGENVRLRIYDLNTGGWGHVTVDNIVYTAEPLTGDQTPPSVPSGLVATVAGSTQVNLTWTASSDPQSGVGNYVVLRDGVQIGTPTAASFADSTVPGVGSYSYNVVAVNADGYSSAASTPLVVDVLGLQSAFAVDATTVQLTFTAPLDQATAENIDHYMLDGGASVIGAALADGNTVLLDTSALVDGQTYTLSVAAVESALGYPVVPQAQATVRYSSAGVITIGLIQDLDADLGVTQSGGVVSTWANQVAGGGDDVAANSGTAQLVAGPNGHQAISLVSNARLAGDDHAAFDSIMQGSGYTWFIVADPDSQVGQAVKNVMVGTLVDGNPWTGFTAGVQQDGRGYHMVRPVGDIFATGSTATITTGYHVYAGRLAAGTGAVLAELFVDSATAQGMATPSISAAINSGALTIGAERVGGGEFFDGDLARVLIYNRPLSDAELNQVGFALAQRYGIATTFTPSGGNRPADAPAAIVVEAGAFVTSAEARPAFDVAEATPAIAARRAEARNQTRHERRISRDSANQLAAASDAASRRSWTRPTSARTLGRDGANRAAIVDSVLADSEFHGAGSNTDFDNGR